MTATLVDRLRRSIARIEQRGPAPCGEASNAASAIRPAVREHARQRAERLSPVDQAGLIYRHAYAPGDHLGAVPLAPPTGDRLQRVARLVELESAPFPATLDPSDLLFLDTETTGLSRGAGTLAFVVGVAGFWGTDGGLVVDQIVLDDPAREHAALELLAGYLERAHVLVSYNGRGFDLPVLRNRALLNRMRLRLDQAHVDLLATCRRHFRARLTDCRLPTVERELLRFFREDDLPGSEAPRVYTDFLRTGDFGQMQRLLEHNRHDIASLAALLPLCADHVLDPLTWAEDGEELLATAKWLLKGDAPELARACLRRTLEICPWAPTRKHALVTLARHLRRSGDSTAAREIWDRARTEFPDWPTGWTELAKYHEHVDKDLEQALSYAHSSPCNPVDDSRRRIERLERRITRRQGAIHTPPRTANRIQP